MSSEIDAICSDKLSLTYYPHFFSEREANQYFNDLYSNIHWREEIYQMFGKRILAPRLVAWYGDEKAIYPYSGVTHKPRPWNTTLRVIKKKVELFCCQQFNSVLLNLYRNGKDSMGWHADNESVLGNKPVIISISLGGQRIFYFKD